MPFRQFYSPNDFGGGLPSGPKQFDVHHSEDKVWLSVINQSNVYFEIYYPDGTYVGSVTENSGIAFLLKPRPLYVLIQQKGSGTATVVNTSLWLGIDTEPLIAGGYQLHVGA